MFSSATELPGYADLTMADKIKVAEWFGWPVPEFNTPEPVLENHSLDDVWTDEVQGTTMSDELSHPLSPPAKPRTHDATSSPPSASGISLNGNKERPSRHVLQVALSSLYAGGSSFSPPTSLTNGGDEQERFTTEPQTRSNMRTDILSTVAHNRDLSSLYDRLSPNAAVTAPKSAGLVGINSFDRESTPLGPGSGKRGVSLHEMELMLLELEEREARARIATAELEVAKYQVKVEAARHAVIEQRILTVKKENIFFMVKSDSPLSASVNEMGGNLYFACVSQSQKKSVGRKLASAEEIRGFNDLKANDKHQINELFGWVRRESEALASDSEEAEANRSSPGNHNEQDSRSALVDHDSTEEEIMDGRTSSHEGNTQTRPWKANSGLTSETLSTRPDALQADGARLIMQLELEEKEGKVRVAEAELQIAEARAKVETARHSVIQQKLKMARDSTVIRNGELQVVKVNGSASKIRHWDCVSKSLGGEIANLYSNAVEIKGYNKLKQHDQEKVDELIQRHRRTPTGGTEGVNSWVRETTNSAQAPLESDRGSVDFGGPNPERVASWRSRSKPNAQSTSSSSPAVAPALGLDLHSGGTTVVPREPVSSINSGASHSNRQATMNHATPDLSIHKANIEIALARIELAKTQVKQEVAKRTLLERQIALRKLRRSLKSRKSRMEENPTEAIDLAEELIQGDADTGRSDAQVQTEGEDAKDRELDELDDEEDELILADCDIFIAKAEIRVGEAEVIWQEAKLSLLQRQFGIK
ncbi:hypothetical protein FRB90_011215 [Tulasnella sp. 427]|nr:hypothetical protein FRB90_011215 [Tulasnella sp. 427]